MIKINNTHILEPTYFPDGTHQVWHLPDEILHAKKIQIDWQFESEAELLHLFSLRLLLPHTHHTWYLNIPYLPYARQDKAVDNDSTFNLKMFGDLINQLDCESVTSFDVHSYVRTYGYIRRFDEKPYVEHFHASSLQLIRPDCIVFPDAGAYMRYQASNLFSSYPRLFFEKKRDSQGRITSHVLDLSLSPMMKPMNRFLIIDDICDGGATFLGMEPQLRAHYPDAEIHLCVSHGIFSNNARDRLKAAGIKVYTTNSLPQRPGELAPHNIL